MKIIDASVELLYPVDGLKLVRRVEECGRVCYKSEDKITPQSAPKFVVDLIRRGHESVLEHVSLSVRFVVDRGVSHEIVRHRLASYSQESTRYCNYSKGKYGGEITVIRPCFLSESDPEYLTWKEAMEAAERSYFKMLEQGCTPQEARSVLPNSLKTELIMTANLREWRHFLMLRCAPAAHPQMQEVAMELLDRLFALLPPVYEDIWKQYNE